MHAPGPPTSYLFIDGANLSKILSDASEKYGSGKPLAMRWSRLRGGHRKIFYFDAVPVQLPLEDENSYTARVAPKRAELAAIERETGFHVRAGDMRHRRRRGNEQKMVDVQFAVDALLMASRGLFSSATLMTGDLDFKPLVSALVDMGIDVNLMYPAGATNEELIAAADSAQPVTILQVADWIDPLGLIAPIPDVSYDIPRNVPLLARQATAYWNDDKYGACAVLRDGSGWHLLTTTCPDHQANYSLNIRGPNADMIQLVAADVFGLTVPKFG